MVNKNAPSLHGLAALAQHYDVALCDIWGVVHDGERKNPQAVEALRAFRQGGGTVVLITNAPRPREDVARQLDYFQVPRDAWDDIVTSGDVTVSLVVEQAAHPLWLIGPPRDRPVLEAAERILGRCLKVAPLESCEVVLCTGLFDDDHETPDDYADALRAMRARDVLMICANPDLVVHRGEQLLYCAGALAQAYENMGGRVMQAGKPFAPIYHLALRKVEAARGRAPELQRVLAIGDGMRTDIAGAYGMGLDSALVMGGIHRDLLSGASLESLAEGLSVLERDYGFAPTFVMSHLAWY